MDMPLPKISIVTVCFNSQETIEDTILSVTKQNYQNIEYIIIDGGSNDDTLKIITQYKNNLSYFVSEPDKGIYDAMNKALEIATGDWLYFLGSDDVLVENTTISSVVSNIQYSDNAYFGYVTFKSSKLDYKFNLTKSNLCYRNISHQSIFYPKVYYKANQYNLRYRLFSDHIYNIIYYSRFSSKIQYLDIQIAVYNDGGASSNPNDPNYYNELPAIVAKYLGFKYAIYVFLRLKIFKLKRNWLKR